MNVAPAKPEFRVTTYGTGKLRSKCGEIWRGSLGERGVGEKGFGRAGVGSGARSENDG